MSTQVTEYEKLVKKSQRTRLEDSLFEEFRLYGLPLPKRQYFFHPTRRFRADFAWPDRKILVEVQGGIFLKGGVGGHNRGGYMEQEYEKQNEAVKLGWRVFKFGPAACRRKKRNQQSSKALEFMYVILKDQSEHSETSPVSNDGRT